MFDKLANEDFERALFKAFWRKIRNWFTGEQNELLPYEEVKERIPFKGQHDLGLMQVRVDQIVGSVGRFRDFDRAFLPVQTHTRDRWISIDKAHYADIILPPVDLYKIGEIYFVKDGNHRISVARERGQQYVDAYVIEVSVPGPVYSEADLDGLIVAEERQIFFAATLLDKIQDQEDFNTTLAGQYPKLLEHIAAHRWFLGEQRGEEAPYPEAVVSWFNNVYLPVVNLIRRHDLNTSFREYSALDLYLWIIEYHWHLRQAFQQEIEDAETAAGERLKVENPDQPIQKLITMLLNTNALDELTAQLEYARFMQQTRLGVLRPGADLSTTIPGAYDRLLEHIAVHRWYLGEKLDHEVTYEEALLSWYDSEYLPLIQIVREQNVLSAFSGRTETDLYLWVLERQWHLRSESGREVDVETAVEELAEEQAPPIKKVLRALIPGIKKDADADEDEDDDAEEAEGDAEPGPD